MVVYAAFSVSHSNLAEVIRYIENQEEHHQRVTFQDEYRAFLQAYGVDYDERYVWGLIAAETLLGFKRYWGFVPWVVASLQPRAEISERFQR